MKYILALIGAYAIIGPIYVQNKLRERRPLKIPIFALHYRARGGVGRLIAVAIGWPAATILNREFGYWIGFAAIGIGLLYFSSI